MCGLDLDGNRAIRRKGLAANLAAAVLGAAAMPALALGGLLLSTSTTLAGGCSLVGGVWECMGPANAGTDTTQSINVGGPVTVTTIAGFGLDVTAAGDDAIQIMGFGGVSFIDNDNSTMSGDQSGLNIYNASGGGVGDVVVKAGTISGGASSALYIENEAGQGAIDVNVVNASGGNSGIDIHQHSDGAVTIVSTGEVVGASQPGIYVAADPVTDNSHSAITINAHDVEGDDYGIRVIDYSIGDISITADGTVQSLTGAGVGVGVEHDLGLAGDILVDVGDVTGLNYGVMVSQLGTGALTIRSSGSIEGTGSRGINASNDAGSTGLIDIGVVDVVGSDYGIVVYDNGSGGTTVAASGTVTASNGAGIAYFGSATGGDVSISAADVTGSDTGISATNGGGGELHIESTGSVTGTTGDGIFADSSGNDLSIEVQDVRGGDDGIDTSYSGSGTATLTVNGTIAGGSGYGIRTWGATTVNIANTATVGSTADNAIFNDGGDSSVNIANGATVNGTVDLGAGSDAINLRGGFSGITTLNGGSGADTLTLHDANTSKSGASIGSWEVFTLDNSTLAITNGSLTVGAGAVGTGVFLTNGSTFDGRLNNFALTGNLALDAGTTFLGSGANSVSGLVSNAGEIFLADGVAGDVFTVGNYTGNNGTLVIDTVLDGDGSATDMLVVTGGTSGNTNVVVNNVGGAGTATHQGIKIIDVTGASNGTFALASGYVIGGQRAVIAGAYGYTLWTDTADGDWYLRSQLLPPVTPGTPADPIYQPGVPIYETYSQVLLAMDGLPTLQQRVGNRYWGDARPSATGATPSVDTNGLWGVMEGSRAQLRPGYSTSGADYDLNTWILRAGTDGMIAQSDSGKLVVGITGQYGQGSASVSSIFGTGGIATDAYGLGATATWYGNSGFYFDSQAQATWFNSNLSSNWVGGLTADNKGFGYALSLEGGQRLDIAQNWAVIPQAQLVYSSIGFDTFTDPFGAQVGGDGADSLRLRLGMAVEHQTSWSNEQGQIERAALHGIANLYNDLLNGASTNVSGVQITSQNDRLWGEIGLGGSYNWDDDKYSLYGQIAASSSLQNIGASYALEGKAGLRVTW